MFVIKYNVADTEVFVLKYNVADTEVQVQLMSECVVWVLHSIGTTTSILLIDQNMNNGKQNYLDSYFDQ